MKKVYIFTEFPNSYAPKRLLEEAEKLNLEPTIVCYKDISIELEKGSFIVLINQEKAIVPDFAVIRSPGKDRKYYLLMHAVLEWMSDNNVRILNLDGLAKGKYYDKFSQHLQFAKANIPFVETKILMSLDDISSLPYEFPYILKSHSGSHGDKVRKIEKIEDTGFFTDSDAPFLAQPFLKIGKDVRVIVLGGKALGAMLRTAQEGKFLTNFSAGGKVDSFDLENNSEVREIAEKTANYFKCEYAGIDLIQDDEGNWKVLEVNRFCQFEGFEMSTGVNVALKMLEQITL